MGAIVDHRPAKIQPPIEIPLSPPSKNPLLKKTPQNTPFSVVKSTTLFYHDKKSFK